MLELNDVLLEGEPRTLSMMAYEGQMTCLMGGTPERCSRWLYGILGFVPVISGFISFDGEPMMPETALTFRQMMAYAPSRLQAEGQICVFEPPSLEDVFELKANQDLTVTNGSLHREMKLVGDVSEEQAQWLAVAVLRDKPILLVDDPPVGALEYLQMQAQKGRIVIVASNEEAFIHAADRRVIIED